MGRKRKNPAAVALRVRERVASLEVLAGGVPLKRTVSLGAATSDDFSAASLTAEGMIESADQALYAAKNGGRNRLCLAPPRSISSSMRAVAAANSNARAS